MADLTIRRRAVRDEQKEERRQAILDAAWNLFQTTNYEQLTMIDVAQSLGLAKGTVFFYFKTKEALFLALVEQQLASWFHEVDTRLQAVETQNTIETVTAVLCQELLARPGLTRLLAILHTLLEQNIDLDAAVRFKYMLLKHFEQTGTLLETCLPFLVPGQGKHLLLQCDALMIGFWHLSDAAPVVKQALQNPELRLFEVNFAQEFSTALHALLYGLQRAGEAKRASQEEKK